MSGYLVNLECTECAATYPSDALAGVSPCCGKVLFARYDLPKIRREVDRDSLANRRADMWRFSELLPVQDPDRIVSLGEGGTPLLAARGLAESWEWKTCTSRRRTQSHRHIQSPGDLRRGRPGRGARGSGLHHAIGGKRRRRCCGLLRPRRSASQGVHASGRPRSQQEECILAGSDLNLVEGTHQRCRKAGGCGRQGTKPVRPLHSERTLPRRGQEDHGAGNSNAVGLETADCHCLSHRRRHRHYRHAKGVSRAKGTGLDRLPFAQVHSGASVRLPTHCEGFRPGSIDLRALAGRRHHSRRLEGALPYSPTT